MHLPCPLFTKGYKRVNLTKALQLLVIKAGAAGYLRVPVFLFPREISPIFDKRKSSVKEG